MIRAEQLSQEEYNYHKQWMEVALEEADKAEQLGEVPIGAVIVHNDQIVARCHNLRESDKLATAHAELLAIEKANRIQDRWRLENTTLYITLEPCAMCAGAIINARVGRVVYGATDPKAGCCGSLMNLLTDDRFNHQPDLVAGVEAERCGEKLSTFFKQLRMKRKASKTKTCEQK